MIAFIVVWTLVRLDTRTWTDAEQNFPNGVNRKFELI